ncbi:MAG: hypothetical protein HKN01_09890 [Acidimicrobiia bacterium]|nr:hypothetical protein [Acidimicrobiia bacterium]NNF70072.1 hypothetical protein [Acidimicrobiia bacterium]
MTTLLPRKTLPRHVTVVVTPAAEMALAHREVALVAELEVLFSCLVRKRVSFRDEAPGEHTWIAAPGLHIALRPVVYDGCRGETPNGPPPVMDFDVADPEALLPRSIRIDFHDGRWQGSFDFA